MTRIYLSSSSQLRLWKKKNFRGPISLDGTLRGEAHVLLAGGAGYNQESFRFHVSKLVRSIWSLTKDQSNLSNQNASQLCKKVKVLTLPKHFEIVWRSLVFSYTTTIIICHIQTQPVCNFFKRLFCSEKIQRIIQDQICKIQLRNTKVQMTPPFC